MITLTTPPQINSILGGSSLIAYNKLVIAPFTMDAVSQTINAIIRLTSTANTTMQPINGTLRINLATAELLVEVIQLDFYRRIILTGPQITSIIGQIEAAQAQLENGLVSLAVIAGVRTSGA